MPDSAPHSSNASGVNRAALCADSLSNARARPVARAWERAALVSFAAIASLVCLLVTSACGSSSNKFTNPVDASNTADGPGTVQPGSDSGTIGSLTPDGGLVDDGGVFADAFTLPENFVPTEFGGYALGPPVSGNGSDAGLVTNGGSSNCSLVVGVVRDFLSYQLQNGGDVDFEHFAGMGPTLGLVQKALGTDRKPVYGGECDDTGSPNPPCLYGQQMTTKASFDQWYRATPNVNDPYLVYLEFVPNGKVFTFQSTGFFPLDNAGFGNTPGFAHNFSFTTELHLKFTYTGGETFSFTGDDDLWVFINGSLAIDLGGLHTPASNSVSLGTLGLTPGTEYDIELFNAERHSTGSNFRVDTNLAFTNCGTLPPDVPPK